MLNFVSKTKNLIKKIQHGEMSVKDELNVWNHHKTWFDPKSSEKFEFDWIGWNESESEVGRSYGGH